MSATLAAAAGPLRVSLLFGMPLPATTGGGERWFAGLAGALAARPDVEVAVHVLRDRRSTAAPPGSTVHRAWAPGGPHGFRVAVAPGALAAARGADVLHVVHYGTVATQAAAAAARLAGATTFVTDLGAGGAGLGHRLGLSPLFDAFLDISAFAASRSPPGRSRVILAGVDARFLDPPDVPREDFALFVGRLLPHKGVDRLIEALPPGRRLVVAGRPASADYLDLLRRRAVGRDVTFVLDPSDARLAGLYAAARVAVLPSVWLDAYGDRHAIPELFGLTAAEAMAAGTPAIVTDVGSLPEVVRDGVTGAVVPAGDPDALRDALERYLADEDLARAHGAAARRRVLEHVTWERVADRCVDAYREAATTRAGGGAPRRRGGRGAPHGPSSVPVSDRPPVDTLQEAVYEEAYDYVRFSPHLKHRRLNDLARSRLRAAVEPLRPADGRPVRVLEVGAGDGHFTEPMLAWGASVTATEMAPASCDRLREHFGANERFSVVLDRDGTLGGVPADQDVAVFVAVLHHVPDYLALLAHAVEHLRPGGSIVTFNDPLRYSRLPRATRAFAEGTFVVWRFGQGNLRRGLATRWRKVRRRQRDDHPSDTVEYHVMRDGVDAEAVEAWLAARFEHVVVQPYWSSQSATALRVGAALGLENSFGVTATGYRGSRS